MELDKRIKSINDIQTVVSSNKKFIGKMGYLAENIGKFKDLSKCKYGTVDMYREDDACFCHFVKFTSGIHTTWYPYFISEDALKSEEPENKYRPFSLEEFLKIFDIGDQIGFRSKDNGEVKHAMFVGYTDDFFADNSDRSDGENDVMIGIYRFSLSYLFENYELYFENEWQPFGVIDEDKE